MFHQHLAHKYTYLDYPLNLMYPEEYMIFLLLIMVLFIPTIFIFYNESAAVYVLIYGIIVTAGNLLGSLIKK